MKKNKKMRVRLKRLMREMQAYDTMNNGKLTSALLVILCFLLLIFLGLLFWIIR